MGFLRRLIAKSFVGRFGATITRGAESALETDPTRLRRKMWCCWCTSGAGRGLTARSPFLSLSLPLSLSSSLSGIETKIGTKAETEKEMFARKP
jgi:hypothetical protein